jgi:hypothetical protein
VPLGDGDSKDEARHLCVDVVNNLPRCMDLITPEQVVEAVESCQEYSAEKENRLVPEGVPTGLDTVEIC